VGGRVVVEDVSVLRFVGFISWTCGCLLREERLTEEDDIIGYDEERDDNITVS